MKTGRFRSIVKYYVDICGQVGHEDCCAWISFVLHALFELHYRYPYISVCKILIHCRDIARFLPPQCRFRRGYPHMFHFLRCGGVTIQVWIRQRAEHESEGRVWGGLLLLDRTCHSCTCPGILAWKSLGKGESPIPFRCNMDASGQLHKYLVPGQLGTAVSICTYMARYLRYIGT